MSSKSQTNRNIQVLKELLFILSVSPKMLSTVNNKSDYARNNLGIMKMQVTLVDVLLEFRFCNWHRSG